MAREKRRSSEESAARRTSEDTVEGTGAEEQRGSHDTEEWKSTEEGRPSGEERVGREGRGRGGEERDRGRGGLGQFVGGLFVGTGVGATAPLGLGQREQEEVEGEEGRASAAPMRECPVAAAAAALRMGDGRGGGMRRGENDISSAGSSVGWDGGGTQPGTPAIRAGSIPTRAGSVMLRAGSVFTRRGSTVRSFPSSMLPSTPEEELAQVGAGAQPVVRVPVTYGQVHVSLKVLHGWRVDTCTHTYAHHQVTDSACGVSTLRRKNREACHSQTFVMVLCSATL